jgi:hypothetical protein
MCEKLPADTWIKRIPHCIADKVDCQDGDHDHQSGRDG